MTESRRYMVLTAVGPDRPGLVQRVSELIHTAGANLEDSRMAILGGEFALILLFSGEPDAVADVSAGADRLGNEGLLSIVLRPTARPRELKNFLPYHLRVSGLDRPGIVARISKVFAGRGINVASLESRVGFAPLSGTPMFLLEASLQVPGEVALAELRRDLGRACEEENLDFVLESGDR